MSVWKIIAPEATHNLVTNPSFEQDTSGWASGHSDTLTRSSVQQFRGAYSLRVQANDTGAVSAYTDVSVVANQQYAISAWFYVPASWAGSDPDLTAWNGAAFTTFLGVADPVGERDQWVRRTVVVTPTSTTLRVAALVPSGNVTGNVFYLDAVQVERKPYPTTYCDGDQPGCRWTAAPHASASERDEFEASGGRLLDFEGDLGFAVERLQGPGMPPVQNHSQALALLPGTRHDGQNVDAKVLSILGSLYDAKNLPEYHARRQALVRAFNSRRRKINGKQQPRSVYYNRAGAEGEDFRELHAVYDGGLEMNRLPRQRGFTEAITLRLRQDDPFSYELQERAALLSAWRTATYRFVGGKISGRWSNLGPPSPDGTYAEVNAVAVGPDGKVYFGGNFWNFNGIGAADHIVRYNPYAGNWEALASAGADNVVRVLKFGPDGRLYIGGAFTSIGGVSAPNFAIYNVSSSTFTSPGGVGFLTGSGTDVRAIEVATDGGVYIGGDFSTGGTVNRIMHWRANSATGVDRGLNAPVYSLAIDANGILYAGGDFTQDVGTSTTMTRIATFDTVNGSTWEPLASPSGTAFAFDDTVEALAVAPDGRTVYIGGEFTGLLQRWNGSTVLDVGTGLTGVAVRDLAFLSDGRLLITGDIDTAGDIGAENFTIWNGSVFAYPDITFPGSVDVRAVAVTDNDDIYVGGVFNGSGVFAAGETISYSGGEPAYPRITIKRTGGTMAQLRYLANETTGAVLYFNYPLLDGETLTLDLDPRNPVFESSFRGRLWQIMRQASHVGDFFLLPANSGSQDNLITLFVAASGFPTMDCRLVWRNAYSGVD